MKSINIKQKKAVLVIIMLVAFFAVGQILFASPVSASLSPDFMEIMAEIGHDMEHIHEDMHVVAYNLRLLAYSNIAIAVFLLIGVIGLFKKN